MLLFKTKHQMKRKARLRALLVSMFPDGCSTAFGLAQSELSSYSPTAPTDSLLLGCPVIFSAGCCFPDTFSIHFNPPSLLLKAFHGHLSPLPFMQRSKHPQGLLHS